MNTIINANSGTTILTAPPGMKQDNVFFKSKNGSLIRKFHAYTWSYGQLNYRILYMPQLHWGLKINTLKGAITYWHAKL